LGDSNQSVLKMTKTATPAKPTEYAKSKQATKQVYYYKDPEYGIDQRSKEVFKNIDKEIHYPLPYKGINKYTNIQKFTYLGFAGKLPVGVYKVYTFGYGFTKPLRPIIDHLNTLPITEVIVEKQGSTNMDLKTGILYLSEAILQTLYNVFSSLLNKQKVERADAAQQYLHDFFPKQVPAPAKTYNAGALTLALADWGNSITEFSDTDKKAIKDLFDKLTILPKFFTDTSLVKTKEIIDNKFIKKALDEFDKLHAIINDTKGLEKKWQTYLKTNSWIFSTLFSQPIILHQDEAYVGGKTIDNKNGKYNDFLIKSGLSNNVSFVEIKTHLTTLIESTPYRGSDVYCVSKDLTGCIAQALNQRDNFQKEFYTITRKKDDIQTFNSKALIIIGTFTDLSEEQKSTFELFRSNSKDVEILTFDELRIKIESLLKILTGKA
jgi:hypothetical protein